MIHIIGDSHVSLFSGTTYMQPTWPGYVDIKGGTNVRASYIKGVRQYRLGPLTAYNFEKNASHWVQDILSLENIDKENDWIFFNLGEIDCSGHLPQQAEKTSITKAVEVCIRKYVTYLASIKAQGYNVGVIGPHIAMWHTKNKQVVEITKRFNEMLMFTGFKYVSILDELLDNPSNDNYIDGYHLSLKVWPLFKEKFLKFTNLEDNEISINYNSYKDLEYWNGILPDWEDVNKKHIYVAGGGIFALVMGMIYNMKWMEGARETAGENIKNLFFQQNKEWVYDEEKGGYVEFDKSESPYNPKDLNMMDFIFDQPKRTENYTYQDDYRGPGNIETYKLNLLVEANQPDILFLRKLTRKLKFNKRMKKLIKNEEEKIDFNNALGVHIRLTDMNWLHKEHGEVNFNDFAKNIDLILEEHPEINTIFVASDNNNSIYKLMDKYKDRIKFIPNLIRTELEDSNSFELQRKNMHTKTFWEESFLDMMMLSKCKYLLHRTSNLANAALLFSDTITNNYNITKIKEMMKSEKIYSKVDPTKLLHLVQRWQDIEEPREDLISEEHFIQCSALRMDKGKTFKPHKHIWKNRTRDVIAQESWIVIKGSVKCIFYDIDDTVIATPILTPGDASFTLEGGHTYMILEDDTLVYEYKTGPYEGQELDKTFLDL